MKQEDAIEPLKEAWREEGVLEKIRYGEFDELKAEKLLELIRLIEVAPGDKLAPDLVKYMWTMPAFVLGFVDDVTENSEEREKYLWFHTQLHSGVRRILGGP
jgi:hypothetical protein